MALAPAAEVPTVAITVSSTAPRPVLAALVRPCAPVVMPTVASAPSYVTESTVAAMPAMLALRSEGASPEGKLDTESVRAVPPAVEPRDGLTRATSGVALTS